MHPRSNCVVDRFTRVRTTVNKTREDGTCFIDRVRVIDTMAGLGESSDASCVLARCVSHSNPRPS
jgi:hypothetical protein